MNQEINMEMVLMHYEDAYKDRTLGNPDIKKFAEGIMYGMCLTLNCIGDNIPYYRMQDGSLWKRGENGGEAHRLYPPERR